MKKKSLFIFDGRVLHIVKNRLALISQPQKHLSHKDIDRMCTLGIIDEVEARLLHEMLRS